MKHTTFIKLKKQIMSHSTQPELLPCDPSLFAGDNADQEEVVTCSLDVIITSFSSIPLEVISSHDLTDLNTKFKSIVEYSIECPIMESFNSENVTSEKSDISGSKSNGRRPKSYELVGYSKTEPIGLFSQETFPSLNASDWEISNSSQQG